MSPSSVVNKYRTDAGRGQEQALASVGTPPWRASERRLGERRNAALASVGTPPWRASERRLGERRNAASASVGTPPRRASERRLGEQSLRLVTKNLINISIFLNI